MQSSGLVLWLAAVVCACEPCLASTSPDSGTSSTTTYLQQRPRGTSSNTLLALVRAATALHHQHHHHHHRPPLLPQQQHHHHHHLHQHIPPPSLPANAQLEYPHLYRRHNVARGDLLEQHQQQEQQSQPQEQQQQPTEDEDLQQQQQEIQQQIPDDERGEAEKRRLAWSKRAGGSVDEDDVQVSGSEIDGAEGQEEAVVAGLQQVGSSIATNFLRHARSGPRPYDVPRIDCPAAEDQMERFPCPSPDRMGRYRCIDDHVLCDGFIDCPDGEDEDRQQCMFYKTTKAHLDVLADAIIRWARGGK